MGELPIDFNGLDTAVNGPLRLGALTALRIEGPLDFTTLKRRLRTHDGAIGAQLRKLEEIGYIATTKRFIGRRPNTTYRITTEGRRALNLYLDAMRRVIDAVESGD